MQFFKYTILSNTFYLYFFNRPICSTAGRLIGTLRGAQFPHTQHKMYSHRMQSSAFHEGELAVQAAVGTVELARDTSEMIAPFVPDGAIGFITGREFVVVTSVIATTGFVWSSVLWGSPGFITVTSPTVIRVSASVALADPLRESLTSNNASDTKPVGLLFIDLRTRRRFRINGDVSAVRLPPAKSTTLNAGDSTLISFDIRIREAFPNCPKYIQRRAPVMTSTKDRDAQSHTASLTGAQQRGLSAQQQAFVSNADTLFLSTFHAGSRRADASHRGGRRGFVRVLGPTAIAFPDYVGNGMFQSLGNVAVCPRAAISIVGWAEGNVLQMTGTAAIHHGNADSSGSESDTDGENTERWVSFSIDGVVEHIGSAPFAYSYIDSSPYNPPVAAEPTACEWVASLRGHAVRGQPHDVSGVVLMDANADADSENAARHVLLRVKRVIQETPHVRTFVFEAADPKHPSAVPRLWRPGQYGTFTVTQPGGTSVVRTWTIASAPPQQSTDEMRTIAITMKLKEGGLVSSQAHHTDAWGVGSTPLAMTGIGGEFSLFDMDETAGALRIGSVNCEGRGTALLPLPNGREGVLFIGGGAGMTPFLSMARALAPMHDTGLDVVVVQAASTPDDIIAGRELLAIARKSGTPMRTHSVVSRARSPTQPKPGYQPSPHGMSGSCEYTLGRLDAVRLLNLVPDVALRHVFLCGPPTFMSAMNEALKSLGVPAAHIDSENFDY